MMTFVQAPCLVKIELKSVIVLVIVSGLCSVYKMERETRTLRKEQRKVQPFNNFSFKITKKQSRDLLKGSSNFYHDSLQHLDPQNKCCKGP
jgi:hypothetical protein